MLPDLLEEPVFLFPHFSGKKGVQGREFPSGGCWGLKVTVSHTVTQWKREAFCDCLTHRDTLKQTANFSMASLVTEGPNHLANVEQGGDWSLCTDHLEGSSFSWQLYSQWAARRAQKKQCAVHLFVSQWNLHQPLPSSLHLILNRAPSTRKSPRDIKMNSFLHLRSSLCGPVGML